MPPTLRGSRHGKAAELPATFVASKPRAGSAKRTARVASGHAESGDESDKDAGSRRRRKRQRRDFDDQSVSTASTMSASPPAVKDELEIVVVRQPRAPRRGRARKTRSRPVAGSSSSSAVSTPASRVEPDYHDEHDHDETPKRSSKKNSNGATSPLAKDFASQISLKDNSDQEAVAEEKPIVDVSHGVASMEAEILKLRRQLSEKEQVIERQHTALSAVHNTLQCQVCLDLLSRPFVLPKCGHVCCQGCLESWFTHCPQGDYELLDGEQRPLHARRKTCPHCRQSVTSFPIQLYLVKTLVGVMDVPNILDKTSTRAATREPSVLGAAADGDGNPFSKFFPPERERNAPIVDYEDGGILRCESCFHEVVEGICTVCGRVYEYDGHTDEWEEGSGDDDLDHDLDDDSEGSLGDFIDDHAPLAPPFREILANLFARGSAFIDEDEDASVDGEADVELRNFAIVISSDEEDADRFEEYNLAHEELEISDDEVAPPARLPIPPPLRPFALGRNNRVVYDMSDDEDEDDELPLYHSRAARVLRGGLVVASDEDDEVSDGGRVLLDDEEEDDDAASVSIDAEEQYWSNDGPSHEGSEDEGPW